MFSYFVLSSVDKKTELTLLFKGQNETQAGCLSDLSCLTPLYLAKVLDLYHEIVLASESLELSDKVKILLCFLLKKSAELIFPATLDGALYNAM